jgi:DNA-binding NtrC family response regulator
MMGRILELEGYEILKAETASSGKKLFESNEVQVVLMDVKLPDGNGILLTSDFKSLKPEVEIICLTAFGNIPDGVKAIKNGAFDYLVKGDDNKKIIPLVSKAMDKAELQTKFLKLQSRVNRQTGFQNVIGKSKAIQEAISTAKKVAPVDTTVLLTGPTGSGKEVFAKAIHSESKRSGESFLAINCSALGKELLESELFGHKPGAFTGATKEKNGLFQEANKGTIFLDEIGELNMDLQAKLLRVLEEGTFIKLGDTKETKVDVRVIAATNRDLEKEVEEGNFREDLFYRLSVFTIQLPALNERLEDIPELVNFFIQQFSVKVGKKISEADKSFLEALKKHNWKGNIRELRNVIERSVILAEDEILQTNSLGFNFINLSGGIHSGLFKLKDLEKKHIRDVLNYCKGNKTKAAEMLDIGVTTLYNKLKEYDL